MMENIRETFENYSDKIKEFREENPHALFLYSYIAIIALCIVITTYLGFFLQKDNFFNFTSDSLVQVFFSIIALITATFITIIQFVNHSIDGIRKEYSLDTADLVKNYFSLHYLASVFCILIFSYFILLFFDFAMGISNLSISVFFFITAVGLVTLFYYMIHIFEMQRIENLIDYYRYLSETRAGSENARLFLCKQLNALYIKLTADSICLSVCNMPVNRTKILVIYENIILRYYDGCCKIPEELGHLGVLSIQSKNHRYLGILFVAMKNIERRLKAEKPALFPEYIVQEIHIYRNLFETICDTNLKISNDDDNVLNQIVENLKDIRDELSPNDHEKIREVDDLINSIAQFSVSNRNSTAFYSGPGIPQPS